jgi:hypothetical protein
MDPEKSATSQFFIIKPELPVKGIASPTNNWIWCQCFLDQGQQMPLGRWLGWCLNKV